MSDSTAAAGYDTITSINFTGGFPSSKDLAASIVFLVAVSGPAHASGVLQLTMAPPRQFVATLPVLVWRLVSPAHRTVILIRPGVFVACRIPMLIIRAIMSKTDYGLGLLSASALGRGGWSSTSSVMLTLCSRRARPGRDRIPIPHRTHHSPLATSGRCVIPASSPPLGPTAWQATHAHSSCRHRNDDCFLQYSLRSVRQREHAQHGGRPPTRLLHPIPGYVLPRIRMYSHVPSEFTYLSLLTPV
jgi:hypothetical protein